MKGNEAPVSDCRTDSRCPDMFTWTISCAAALQNPSTLFWDWISMHTGNSTLGIYQAVLSLILNVLIWIFKKMQHIDGKNNQPLS